LRTPSVGADAGVARVLHARLPQPRTIETPGGFVITGGSLSDASFQKGRPPL
jgi:hypothetical protein